MKKENMSILHVLHQSFLDKYQINWSRFDPTVSMVTEFHHYILGAKRGCRLCTTAGNRRPFTLQCNKDYLFLTCIFTIFSSPCQMQRELLPSLGIRRPLTFHILIFLSETPQPNELKLSRKHL